MTNKILLIFEGKKTERQLYASLAPHFFSEHAVLLTAYSSDVYSLYNVLADEDVDLFLHLRDERKEEQLQGISKEEVAEIYLFFDYDGHSSRACDTKVEALLERFNDETESGKLYLSYPMVEAVKHLHEDQCFKTCTVPAKLNINYKNQVNKEGCKTLQNLHQFSTSHWLRIANANLKKFNYVMTGSYSVSEAYYEQVELFQQQDEQYIQPTETIAVLSAFPLFLADYFGATDLLQRLNSNARATN